jgi:hypothetical protein
MLDATGVNNEVRWYAFTRMQPLRRRLSWMLAGWLVIQLVTIVAPVALVAAGVSLEETCTCPGVDHGATCPMHHPSSAKSKDANQCAMRSAAAPADVVLLPLSVIGLLPSPATVAIEMTPVPVIITVSALVGRTELPDSPPPRA